MVIPEFTLKLFLRLLVLIFKSYGFNKFKLNVKLSYNPLLNKNIVYVKHAFIIFVKNYLK